MRIQLLLSVIVLFVCTSSFAAKKYSAQDGNWTTGSTWVGGVAPVANDTVFILSQHAIEITANLYGNTTYMFIVILGTLDLTDNGKLRLNASSKVIIETGGQVIGDGSQDQITIGAGGAEYNGSQGTITGPSYISNGHTPTSGEGTSGCGCYSSMSVASCAVTSSAGYTVNILVWAQKILVETNPCTWGYNYDVRLNYSISFTGTPPVGGLYTLQGNIFCGASSMYFDLPNSGGTGSVDSQGNAWRNVSDCGTATPQSLNCYTATIQIEGPGLSYTTCTGTLPIKLLSFEAETEAQGARLNWITSMEKDFDYFQIERAQQDLSFTPIATVAGKGGNDINVAYDYLDQMVKSGKNYYRLKSVDLDGSYEYSKVVYIDWSTPGGIRVYPNPTADHHFTIELNDRISSPALVRLVDRVGHTVFEAELSTPTSTVQLPKTISPGLYHLMLFSQQGQETVKVVIQ